MGLCPFCQTPAGLFKREHEWCADAFLRRSVREGAERAIADAARIAFACGTLASLPTEAVRIAAPAGVAESRIGELLFYVWCEQVAEALADGVLTDDEASTLQQALYALELQELAVNTPAFARFEAALSDPAMRPKPKKRRARRKKAAAVVIEVSADGDDQGGFDVAAVGESHYQPALRAALAGRESRAHCDAALVPEDSNEFDSQAVRVDVHGECVGYLNRSHARVYRQRYGARSVSCKGVLCGGDEGRPSIGIWLDVLL